MGRDSEGENSEGLEGRVDIAPNAPRGISSRIGGENAIHPDVTPM